MKTFLLILGFMLTTGLPAANAQQRSVIADTLLARKWFLQGMVWQRSRQDERANKLFVQAAALYRKHQLWALQFRCDNQMARGLLYMGQSGKALAVTSQVIRESIDRLGKDNPEQANAYHVQALILNDSGEHDQALDANRQTLRIRLKLLGENHRAVANSYNNIGKTYAEKGDYEQAMHYHQLAMRIRIVALGEVHPQVAVSYNNIANIYERKGEYDKALEYYQKAFELWQQNQGIAHPDIPSSYHSLGGNVYFKKGEYGKALEYFQKALQLRSETLGEVHEEVAHIYVYMGRIYEKIKAYDQALASYQKALQIRHHLYREDHAAIAESYTSIGAVYKAKGDYAQALASQGKALQIRSQFLSRNHSLVAVSYNNLAELYTLTGQDQQALRQVQQAILANIPAFQDTSIHHNPILTNRTGSYLDGKTLFNSLRLKIAILERNARSDKAPANLLLAYQTYCTIDTLAQQIRRAYAGERDQIGFITGKAMLIYKKALTLCLNLYALTHDPTYLAHAFAFAERGKASVLSATLAESNARTFAGIPDSLLEQAQDYRTQIARYGQQIAKELARGETLDSSRLHKYQAHLFAVNRQQENLINALEKNYPHYFSLKYQRVTVTPTQLQQVLNDQMAVLEYVLADTLLHQFIITRRTFEVRSISLDSRFRQQITAFREAVLDRDEELYLQVGYALHRLLLAPSLPRSIRQLIVIPGDELATLSFEALPIQHPRIKAGKPRSYLLHHYAVSYAYSARLLYERLTKQGTAGSTQLLAMAPVFADTLPAAIGPSSQAVLTYPSTTRGKNILNAPGRDTTDLAAGQARPGRREILADRLIDSLYVAPLPASQREVEMIARLFRRKGALALVYLHGQAREEQIKSKNLPNYRYLHLATHGFVNEDYPELSGLLLAQDRSSSEDGILYSGEMYNLRLQADLVTLSACETGLGRIAPGEGVIGLTRALLYAGAQNVIVSLWQVSDASTADFMAHFYKALLRGQDKAQALQTAKMKLMWQGYSQPYFWAPFILVGK